MHKIIMDYSLETWTGRKGLEVVVHFEHLLLLNLSEQNFQTEK